MPARTCEPLTKDTRRTKVSTVTTDDVDRLHGLAHGLQVDLLAMITLMDTFGREAYLENALSNVGKMCQILDRKVIV